MNNPAIELRNVNYSYRSDWARRSISVIKDISLSVEHGEAFGFLGHNGAGKTTTIKCILSICNHRNGVIKIDGEDNRSHKARRLIGYLPEQPYFYDNLSVDESLLAYGQLAEVPPPALKTRIGELLHLFSLTEKRNSKMRALSKGLMQRVGMAQSVISKPSILILDEPFSGLDPIGRKEFRDIILDLKTQGTTIFMSSHILSDVETICDRASIMVRGEIKGIYDLKAMPSSTRAFEISISADSTLTHVKKLIVAISPSSMFTEQNNFARITLPSYQEAIGCLELLIKEKINIHSFEPSGSSLEDLFVKLVQEGQ